VRSSNLGPRPVHRVREQGRHHHGHARRRGPGERVNAELLAKAAPPNEAGEHAAAAAKARAYAAQLRGPTTSTCGGEYPARGIRP
jgi:hypothetical protein